MRTRLSKKSYRIILITLLVVFALILISKVKMSAVIVFFSGVKNKVSSDIYYFKDTMSSIKYVSSAREGIEKLTKINMELDAENQELRSENVRMRKKLGLDTGVKRGRPLHAHVIAANTDGFIQYYLINRGRADGVSEGDGIVAGGAAMGRIVEVFERSSKVQLITDLKSSISARNARSRVVGILAGSGINECSLLFVPKEEDIKKEDVMETSGIGKSFPAGIRIGRVINVNRKTGGLSMAVKIKPFVDTFTVEDVLVLKRKGR